MERAGTRDRKLPRAGVAVAATMVGIGSLTSGAPAAAETATVDDGQDTPILADIGVVKVSHGADRLRVKVTFDDLVRDPVRRSQGLTLFIDTDPSDPGPEYAFAGGLNQGSDYVLTRVDRWADEGKRVARCHQTWRINWRKDVVRTELGRACLGSPETVRVAVKSGEWSKGRGTRYDWLTGRRVFTSPLVAG